MKKYIRSSVITNQDPGAVEIHFLCDGKDSGDNAQSNSFYMEAYSADGDTIWIGKTNDSGQPDYPDKYSLETAKEGHIYSSADLPDVLDEFLAEFDVTRKDFIRLFNFARRYSDI